MHTTFVYTYDVQTLDERKAWFDMKNKANEPIFVFEQAGKVVGFATYGQFRNWPAYLYSIEHSIYVDKSNRGKGIASQLLQHLIEDARTRNYRTIVVVSMLPMIATSNYMKSLTSNMQVPFKMLATNLIGG